jgi:Carboxypeptidase regulatory-like domain/TonB-dependent Receptor Plug Domain
MKHCRVSAFSRVARILACAAVGLGLGAGTLFAQGSTGKLEGRVRDQAGAPIANAQVFVVGTAFNALTNPQGYYFINNVSAGTVAVRANFIGYKSTQVEGVKVLAGQTITVDVQLEQTAVQIQEITVVTETQPLVPRDEVASKQRIDGTFTEKLPVDRLNSVLVLQPGVVAANATGSQLSIRGGRTQEAVTYVDGVPVTPGYRGDSRRGSLGTEISVGTNSLEEASVTTGSSSAEFGNAQSGVISVATRTGGSNYAGTINYETDEPFGVDHSVGFNRVTGSFSGPLSKNFTFFVSGVLEGQQSVESGMDSQKFPIFLQAGIDTTVAVPTALDDPTADTTYVNVYNYAISRGECDTFKGSANQDIANNYGVDCQGIRLPWSARSTYQLTGKLNYTFGTGSRVAFTALRSQFQGRTFRENLDLPGRLLTYGVLSAPQNLPAFRNYSNVFTLNWTQNLTRSTERALALDMYVSYQTDRTLNGTMTTESELSTRNPTGGFLISPIDFLFNFDNFPIDDELLKNYRQNIPGSRRSPYNLENTAQYALTDEWRNNAYGLYNADEFASVLFPEGGGPAGTSRFAQTLILYREDRWLGKANLDWQFDRYNRIKLGGEYTHYKLDSYSHQLDSQAFSDFYREQPIRWNAFIEDRVDLGDVVVVGGIRYDRYDTRARRWANFPRISTDPSYDPNNPDAFFTSDSLFPQDQAHDYLSPHIQVSFPVTDRTNFRFSYAHQVQAPDFGVVLQGINTDLSTTNTNNFYGSDLDFGKTITFEFGIRHAFSDDMVLDIAAYNKDNLSNAAGRLVSRRDPLRGTDQNIRVITNADFGNTRGIDVRLDRRFGNYFNGTVAYTYQNSKNTGSDPDTYLDFGSRVLNQVSGGNQPPPQAILQTDFNRPHNLALAGALNFPNDFLRGRALGAVLQNVGLFATFRYTSGTPYTPCSPNVGDEDVVSGDNCNRTFPEPLNSSRLPSYKNLDLRLTKGFALRGVDITGYVEARNVLNFKNVIQVFTTTNDVANARERAQNFAADSADFALEADASGALLNDGSIDLSFNGATDPRTGCGDWLKQDGSPGAPNCVALIRTEERYGNGDHIFSLDEQLAASNALYDEVRGIHNFTSAPRRFRLGVELNF